MRMHYDIHNICLCIVGLWISFCFLFTLMYFLNFPQRESDTVNRKNKPQKQSQASFHVNFNLLTFQFFFDFFCNSLLFFFSFLEKVFFKYFYFLISVILQLPIFSVMFYLALYFLCHLRNLSSGRFHFIASQLALAHWKALSVSHLC